MSQSIRLLAKSAAELLFNTRHGSFDPFPACYHVLRLPNIAIRVVIELWKHRNLSTCTHT